MVHREPDPEVVRPAQPLLIEGKESDIDKNTDDHKNPERSEAPTLPGNVGGRRQHDNDRVDGEKPDRNERGSRCQPQYVARDPGEVQDGSQYCPGDEQDQ